MNADSLLRSTAKGEAGALAQLIEATADQAYRHVGGDEVKLLGVYQMMLEHLDQVHRKASFWSWFAQIAGPANEIATGPASPALRQALSCQAVVAQPRASQSPLGDRVARLYQSGWLAVFGAAIFSTSNLLLSEYRTSGFLMVDAVAALTLSVLNATAVSWLLGPWLPGWKREMAAIGRPLTLSLMVLASFAVSCLLVVTSTWLTSVTPDFRLALEIAVEETFTAGSVLASLAVSGVLELLGRSFKRQRPWMLYRGDSPGRRGPAAILLTGWLLWLALSVVSLVVSGWSLSSSLLSLKQPTTQVREYFLGDRDLFDKLPETYSKDPYIDPTRFPGRLHPESWTAQQDQTYRETAAKAWLREAVPYWSPQELEGKATLHRFSLTAGQLWMDQPRENFTPSIDQIEVRIRRRLVREHRTLEVFPMLQALPANWVTPRQWEKLADAAQSAQWLLRSRADSFDNVLGGYAVAALRAQTQEFPPPEGSEPGWFDNFRGRRELNRRWRRFRGLAVHSNSKPWRQSEELEVIEYLDACDHQDPGSGMRQVLLGSTADRQTAELALYLELKRELTSGAKPKDLRELRPPFVALADAYDGWFGLSATASGVDLLVYSAEGKLDHTHSITP